MLETPIFALAKELIFFCSKQMVIVAQLVRASDCGSEGRGFETRLSPFLIIKLRGNSELFLFNDFKNLHTKKP